MTTFIKSCTQGSEFSTPINHFLKVQMSQAECSRVHAHQHPHPHDVLLVDGEVIATLVSPAGESNDYAMNRPGDVLHVPEMFYHSVRLVSDTAEFVCTWPITFGSHDHFVVR